MTKKLTESQKGGNENFAAGEESSLVQGQPSTSDGLGGLHISPMADIDDLLSAVGSGSMRNELPYDLRNKRENVLTYMKNHVKIPISQRKRMVRTLEKRLNRQVDIKSDKEFYNAFFDFVEEKPSRIVHMAVLSSFPDINDKRVTSEKLNKSVSEFAPVKLIAKTSIHGNHILDRVYQNGYSCLDDLDIIGLFFHYGFVHGFSYLTSAAKFVETKNIHEGLLKEIAILKEKISISLNNNKFSDIPDLCNSAVPIYEKLLAAKEERDVATEKLIEMDNEVFLSLAKEDNHKEGNHEETIPLAKSPSLDISTDEENDDKSSNTLQGDSDDTPAVSSEMSSILCNLIEDGNIGIAARFSEALERTEGNSPIPASSLWLAAASRISLGSLDASAQEFMDEILQNVYEDDGSSNGNAIIAGSLLCMATLRPDLFRTRETIGQLDLDHYNSSIGDLVREISRLGFSFSPSLEELSDISKGVDKVSRIQIEKELGDWKRSVLDGSYAGIFRIVVGSNGELGRIINMIIDRQEKAAEESAPEVLKRLETPDLILSYIEESRQKTGGKSKRRFQADYVCRRLVDGMKLVQKWLDATENENVKYLKDKKTIKSDLKNIKIQVAKALNSLENKTDFKDDIDIAICGWLAKRVRQLKSTLDGEPVDGFDELKDARYRELDLIPVPSHYTEPSGALQKNDEELISFLLKSKVPSVDDAISSHIKTGAFGKAIRLLRSIKGSGEKEKYIKKIESEKKTQYDDVLVRIENSITDLTEVKNLDINRPEYIEREADMLQIIREDLLLVKDIDLEKLEAATKGKMSSNIGEILSYLSEIENLVKKSRSDIRQNQKVQLEALREKNPDRSEEIDELISSMYSMPLIHVEDLIADIRDGRAFGHTKARVVGSFDEFFPNFVKNSEEESWPKGHKQFIESLESNGQLSVPDDRREAVRRIIDIWFELSEAVESGTSVSDPLRNLLQNLSFHDVRMNHQERVQDCSAFVYDVNMKVPEDRSRTWFVPPVFGSRSYGNYSVVVMHPSVLFEQVRLLLKSDGPVIIIVTGRLSVDSRKEMAGKLRHQGVKALVLDETLMAFIASRREERLEVLFDCGLPFGRVEPYVTTPGELPPEIFFGREQEIERIIGQDAEGILVYGGRQLGKSALLAQIKMLHHRPENQYFVTLDDVKYVGTPMRDASEIWRMMAKSLSELGIVREETSSLEDIISDVESWVSENPSGRILCLFDEADNFLAYEAKSEFLNLVHLKGLMERTHRRFKAVFAGLHHVQRMFKSSNSPLAHFGSGICIGPFSRTSKDREAARRLVEVPMRAAGFHFENSSAPNEVLSCVNHYPSLVQVYGKELIAHLNSIDLDDSGPLWKISNDALSIGPASNSKIWEEICDKFSLTLDLDPRYRLIAYLLGYLKWNKTEYDVLHQGLTAHEISNEASYWWPKRLEPISIFEMKTILDEMFDLGILGKPDNRIGRYVLRTNQVANMLGSKEEVEGILLDLDELGPPLDYNPGTHRSIMSGFKLGKEKDARNISPLTDYQMQMLLQGDEDRLDCRFVAGTRMLGLDYVTKAMVDFSDRVNRSSISNSISVHVVDSSKKFGDEMRSGPREAVRIKVVVYYPKDELSDKLIRFADNQALISLGNIRPILIVDASDSRSREIVTNRDPVILRPWGEEMLRSYLVFAEENQKDRFLDCILDKTGGIPDSIIRLLSDLKKSGGDQFSELENMQSTQVDDIADDGDIVKITKLLCDVQRMADEDSESVGHLYEVVREQVRSEVDTDLDTVGNDLMTLGILDAFDPKKKNFRITHFGRLIATQKIG